MHYRAIRWDLGLGYDIFAETQLTNLSSVECFRTRNIICVLSAKILVLMLPIFAEIFPSYHPTSSFLRCLLPSVFSRVFCESRLVASSSGHTMMFVKFESALLFPACVVNVHRSLYCVNS